MLLNTNTNYITILRFKDIDIVFTIYISNYYLSATRVREFLLFSHHTIHNHIIFLSFNCLSLIYAIMQIIIKV